MADMWSLTDEDYHSISFLPASLHQTGDCGGVSADNKTKDDGSDLDLNQNVRVANEVVKVTLTPEDRLRSAITCRGRRQEIPTILSTWPKYNLRLCSVVSSEECLLAFPDPDHLWSLVFRGLIYRDAACRLVNLDLSNFPPSEGLVYLLLQIYPLLTLPLHCRDKASMLDSISTTVGPVPADTWHEVEKFVAKLLTHRLFQRDVPSLLVSDTDLHIIIEGVPVSSRSLQAGLITVLGLKHLLSCQIIPRSAVCQFTDGCYPSLALRLLQEDFSQELEGILLCGCTTSHLEELITADTLFAFSNIHKMGLTSCDLTSLAKYHSENKSTRSKLDFLFNVLRLDLAGSNIKEQLELLLDNVKCLESLRLQDCHLLPCDAESLVQSHHTQTLRELDMEGTNLSSPGSTDTGSCTEHVADIILQNVSKFSQIVVLNLGNTVRECPKCAEALQKACQDLCESQSLKCLMMGCIALSDKDLIHVVSSLSKSASLQRLMLSRSSEAPSLSTEGAISLWGEVACARDEKHLMVSILNMFPENLCEPSDNTQESMTTNLEDSMQESVITSLETSADVKIWQRFTEQKRIYQKRHIHFEF